MGKIKVENGIISNKRADKEQIILRKYQDIQAENARQRNKNNDLEKPSLPLVNNTEPEPITDTNVSGGKPPDLAKIAFDRGRALLTAAGKSDGSARKIIGGWRKTNPDDVIIAAIASCERAGAVEPVSYCEAIFRKSKPPTGAVASGAFGMIPERTG